MFVEYDRKGNIKMEIIHEYIDIYTKPTCKEINEKLPFYFVGCVYEKDQLYLIITRPQCRGRELMTKEPRRTMRKRRGWDIIHWRKSLR